MKNKKQLIESLDGVFQEYVDNLWKAPDPNLLKSEFDEMWEWSMGLKTNDIEVDDVLCISDMMKETEHKHLFEVKNNFEFKF